jgi:hypothetical protein
VRGGSDTSLRSGRLPPRRLRAVPARARLRAGTWFGCPDLPDARPVLQFLSGWQFERWQRRLAEGCRRSAKLATGPCYTFWCLFHAAPVNIETDLGVEAVAQERRRYFRRCSDQTLHFLHTLQLLQGLRETERDAYWPATIRFPVSAGRTEAQCQSACKFDRIASSTNVTLMAPSMVTM